MPEKNNQYGRVMGISNDNFCSSERLSYAQLARKFDLFVNSMHKETF
jgi:hypothetical protein